MVFDWDDQCDEWDALPFLDELKKLNSKFKANLFVIPKKTSIKLFKEMKKRDWIQIIPHGYWHNDNWECEKWTKIKMLRYIDKMLLPYKKYFVNGFKAPGWQISDGCYEGLLERGWWVMDQARLNDRRPAKLKVFLADNTNSIHYHGHTHDVCHNGIEESMDNLRKLIPTVDKFDFISEVVKESGKYEDPVSG